MYRVRQSLNRQRLADIPAGVRTAMAEARLPIKRGDTVAVGAGSRGIANIAVIVRAVVDHLKALGAKPFVFPAMGSHGGATAEGQLEILAHYGITEATMGCPLRASMDVVQAGEALGLPVWCDRIASEADWIGVVNRVKPHTDFKGSIESGLFKMMTIGLGKYHGATQYHRANVNHGYETVITAVGREMLAKARIGFGLGIVENGYDETAKVEAFNAEDLEAGERRLLKEAREWMARLPFSPIDVLVVEEIGKNISGAGMDTNIIGRPSNPHEPFPNDPKILWIVALDLTEDSGGNATGIGNADFTTRRLAEKIDWKKTAINCLTACAPNGAKMPLTFDSDREAVDSALELHRADEARAGAGDPDQEHAHDRGDRVLRGLPPRDQEPHRPRDCWRGKPARLRRRGPDRSARPLSRRAHTRFRRLGRPPPSRAGVARPLSTTRRRNTCVQSVAASS